MMILNYTKSALALPDSDAKNYVLGAYELGREYLNISTENAIYALRLLVKEGLIPHDKVTIYRHGFYFTEVREDGSLINPVPSYIDEALDILLGLKEA